MTTRDRARRRGGAQTFPRRTLAAIAREVRRRGDDPLAAAIDTAVEAWLTALNRRQPASLPGDETERLADLLVTASTLLMQDEDPSLGCWAVSAGAALHAHVVAEQDGPVDVHVTARRAAGAITSVTLRAHRRGAP